mgnify:CR=1 FL=1
MNFYPATHYTHLHAHTYTHTHYKHTQPIAKVN